jgi:nucleotidyltransferase substrate binding protein (TIGR01987 family)
MTLDISPLIRAIARLEEGLAAYQRNTSETLIRDGLIQRFEFTYEIAHKMLKRYLEVGSPTPDQYENMLFPDLIRSGNEQGLLLGDWLRWKGYRDMRAKTSHTYDEAIALEVIVDIPSFLEEARYFRDVLEQRVKG